MVLLSGKVVMPIVSIKNLIVMELMQRLVMFYLVHLLNNIEGNV